MRLFIIAALFSFSHNLLNLLRAFNYIAALESKVDLSWLNLSWCSFSTPISFTECVVSILLSYRFNLFDTELSVLLRTVAWNLSGLVIIWLLLNKSIACFASFSKVRRRSLIFLQEAVMVLSSAKSSESESCRYKNRSFRNASNNSGPNIEP